MSDPKPCLGFHTIQRNNERQWLSFFQKLWLLWNVERDDLLQMQWHAPHVKLIPGIFFVLESIWYPTYNEVYDRDVKGEGIHHMEHKWQFKDQSGIYNETVFFTLRNATQIAWGKLFCLLLSILFSRALSPQETQSRLFIKAHPSHYHHLCMLQGKHTKFLCEMSDRDGFHRDFLEAFLKNALTLEEVDIISNLLIQTEDGFVVSAWKLALSPFAWLELSPLKRFHRSLPQSSVADLLN